jgi:hypothetical protein
MAAENPKVFISYSWDDDPHKAWVKAFATRLRADGVDVTLDQWATVPGDKLPRFMEQAIRENAYVLIVCTPNYKKKSDNREGGVGYEGDIMTGEVFTTQNHRKFIPVLRRGDFKSASPSWLTGAYGIDLRADPLNEQQYGDLTATLYKRREQAPPLGKPLAPTPQKSIREAAKEFYPTKEPAVADFELIQITGIIIDEIGEPKNDGSRGSALYPIPFKLSRKPTHEWGELFKRNWDRPPSFTTQHRPGTARVDGDRIVLTQTTIEEVESTHRATLKLALDETNRQVAGIVRKRAADEQAQKQRRDAERERIRKLAEGMEF